MKLIRGKAAKHYVKEELSNLDKIRKASKKISDYLGDTKEEILLRNDQIMGQNEETKRKLSLSRREIKEKEERVKDLEKENKKISKTITGKEKVVNQPRDQLEKFTSPEEKKRLDEEVRRLKKDLEEQRLKNQNTMRENNAEIERLREQLDGDEPDGVVQQQIETLEAENERLGERNEEIFPRMSLRDKVKYIFKKYGLTVFGVQQLALSSG